MLWFGLLVCNLIWSINPSVAKVLIAEVGPEFTAWIKYAGALVAYLGVLLVFSSVRRVLGPLPKSKSDWAWVCLIGVCTCFVSPMAQMLGLTTSTATNNSILVSFEPLFAMLFGWLFIGEKISRKQVASFCVAVAGFSLLSNLVMGSVDVARGDLLLLTALAAEAVYTVFSRALTRRYSPLTVYGLAISIGAALLTVSVFARNGLPPLSSLSVQGWLAVLWLGPVGAAVPYVIWLYALRGGLPLGGVVLTLFLQPVLGAWVAMVFLGERLSLNQWVGAALILLAVGVQSIPFGRLGLRFRELGANKETA